MCAFDGLRGKASIHLECRSIEKNSNSFPLGERGYGPSRLTATVYHGVLGYCGRCSNGPGLWNVLQKVHSLQVFTYSWTNFPIRGQQNLSWSDRRVSFAPGCPASSKLWSLVRCWTSGVDAHRLKSLKTVATALQEQHQRRSYLPQDLFAYLRNYLHFFWYNIICDSMRHKNIRHVLKIGPDMEALTPWKLMTTKKN